jgi:hypothetical protein
MAVAGLDGEDGTCSAQDSRFYAAKRTATSLIASPSFAPGGQ